MIKKTAAYFIVLGIVFGIGAGCGKLDTTAKKMPKFKFITTENLHSIASSSQGRIWMSGNYGTIMYSADEGKSWKKQKTGVEEMLGCIEFVSAEEGWAAGVKGTIFHTDDAGQTWIVQKSGTENDLFDLFFLDNQLGWAVGEYGTVIHTDNGGKTWLPQVEEKDTIFNDVFFANPRKGWIVGEFGTILHTEDGGSSWQPQLCQDIVPVILETEWERPMPALYGLYFTDNNTGWITGMEGVILHTEDGGTTWTKIESGTANPLYSIQIMGSKGWAVGNKGAYTVSSDGGKTWELKADAIKTKFWLRDVEFYDEANGIIVGSRGTIAKSGDAGVTWQLVSGFSYEMEEFGLADF